MSVQTNPEPQKPSPQKVAAAQPAVLPSNPPNPLLPGIDEALRQVALLGYN